jgi:hypothetical protein
MWASVLFDAKHVFTRKFVYKQVQIPPAGFAKQTRHIANQARQLED